MLSAMSFMKIVNKTGPRILPCGIPLNTSALDENFFPTCTLWVLSYRKLFTKLWTPPVIPYIISLLSSRSYGTESKAFLKSKQTHDCMHRFSLLIEHFRLFLKFRKSMVRQRYHLLGCLCACSKCPTTLAATWVCWSVFASARAQKGYCSQVIVSW